MAKTKQLYSRNAMLFAGALVVLAIGLAAITHADERGERGERPERDNERGGKLLNISGISNIMAKLNVQSNIQTPDLRVRIDSSDNVRIQGAVVSATSSAGFTATVSALPLTFIVQTDSGTKFHIKGKGNGSMADIAVGDTVRFRGVALSGTTTSTVTLKATNVEDKTPHPKPPKPVGHVTIKGTVQSVSTTANSLVIVGPKGTTTVSVSSGTAIVNEVGNTLALSGITPGSQVKASGTLDANTHVFAATKLVMDSDNDVDQGIGNLNQVIERLQALINFLKNLQIR